MTQLSNGITHIIVIASDAPPVQAMYTQWFGCESIITVIIAQTTTHRNALDESYLELILHKFHLASKLARVQLLFVFCAFHFCVLQRKCLHLMPHAPYLLISSLCKGTVQHLVVQCKAI